MDATDREDGTERESGADRGHRVDPAGGAADDADARARARAEQLVGRTLDGRYRIDAVLAMGGMGAVYAGRHLRLRKRIALKVLHPDVEGDAELVRRFEREALAGAQVAHPHVACATDFGELPDGTRYLVMEHVRGGTLRELVTREGRLDPDRAARIGRQIAVALGEIHARGIVHRDLKPRNVMLAEGEFVKIVDFGLAKIEAGRLSTMSEQEADDDARLTSGGVVFGTFGHLAPEAALGMEAVDARADLYALGVMLFEMLAGVHPYEAKSDLELFARQRTRPAPRFADRVPGLVVPEALERVVLRLLERDPAARFQDAAAVVAAIDVAEPTASQAPPPPPEQVLASLRPGAPDAVDDAGPLDEVENAVRKVWAPLADAADAAAPARRAPGAAVTGAPAAAPARAPVAGAARRGRLGLVLAALVLLAAAAIAGATCGGAAEDGQAPARAP